MLTGLIISEVEPVVENTHVKVVERCVAYHEGSAIYGDGMDAPYIYCKGDIYGS